MFEMLNLIELTYILLDQVGKHSQTDLLLCRLVDLNLTLLDLKKINLDFKKENFF